MILCCGEALIDFIPESVSGALTFTPCCGGSVCNSAVALGRLEIPVALWTGISDDTFGAMILSKLEQNGVDVSYLKISSRLTTLAFVHFEENQPRYTFYDENSAGRMLEVEDLPKTNEGITALLFGGVSLAHNPAADTFLALAQRESGQRLILLDPNIRPHVIHEELAYRQRLKAMIDCSNIIKFSDEDLDWITEGEDQKSYISRILDTGADLIIVTKGANGANAFLPDGTVIHINAVPALVNDSVGAGDTYNAAFLARLFDLGCLELDAFQAAPRETIENALGYAAKAASIVVTRQGADPPRKQEL